MYSTQTRKTPHFLARLGRTAGLSILLAALLGACAATRESPLDTQIESSRVALQRFVDRDPDIQRWIDGAHAYAVYPEIGKGGFIAGGAFGRGIVFERGQPIGRTTVSQATFGAQIGGQTYRQVIFFEDEAALRTFQREQFEFSAQATAVAANAGAATSTSYERGVAVFVMTGGGLMAEATVGGQKFTYEPL